ncbi:MAG: methyltransferase domain-containing protein [Alphaproteobacteria bacterium]|nr:methyltransferase domain-containing protein [Alphaproteobacteria bacterium]
MDLTQAHKSRKQTAYWANLVGGETAVYKARVIDDLIATHRPGDVDSLLDIGCGTSEVALHYLDALNGRRLVGLDYDEAVVSAAARRYTDPRLEWRRADIFELDRCADRFQLVFLLDMLHEVYSFYGRPNRELAEPIDHALGLEAAREALTKVAQVVSPGGGVVITDNVLCPTDSPVSVRVKTPEARDAVRRFLAEYPARRMRHAWLDGDVLDLSAHDFCILLTQYNKIKRGDEARWNVEKLEIHQYMTVAEYRSHFAELGFTMHAVVGTPPETTEEWNGDFEAVSGLPALPEKRITLLAVRS